LRRCDFVPEAPVGLVVDLAAPDAERMPPAVALEIRLKGIITPRIPVGSGFAAFPLVVAALLTPPGSVPDPRPSHDCRKEFGNHISPTIATE
ncbi:hypothetical protein, partial [Klebsiella pneumoniae]|uniref:hypothetical protein n=1 Tax=Klebsiella pneumoniae TaxID=573 RepID=UPI00371FC5D7